MAEHYFAHWHWRRRRKQSFGVWESSAIGLDENGRPAWSPAAAEKEIERLKESVATWERRFDEWQSWRTFEGGALTERSRGEG